MTSAQGPIPSSSYFFVKENLGQPHGLVVYVSPFSCTTGRQPRLGACRSRALTLSRFPAIFFFNLLFIACVGVVVVWFFFAHSHAKSENCSHVTSVHVLVQLISMQKVVRSVPYPTPLFFMIKAGNRDEIASQEAGNMGLYVHRNH